jgi:hypothetical protein
MWISHTSSSSSIQVVGQKDEHIVLKHEESTVSTGIGIYVIESENYEKRGEGGCARIWEKESMDAALKRSGILSRGTSGGLSHKS